jgi:hypothetical protein
LQRNALLDTIPRVSSSFFQVIVQVIFQVINPLRSLRDQSAQINNTEKDVPATVDHHPLKLNILLNY